MSSDTGHYSKPPGPWAPSNFGGLSRCRDSSRCHVSNRVGVTGRIKHFTSETGSVVSSSPSASSHAPLLGRKNVFFIQVHIIVMVITSRKPAQIYDWLSVRGTDLPNNLALFALIGNLCRRDTQAWNGVAAGHPLSAVEFGSLAWSGSTRWLAALDLALAIASPCLSFHVRALLLLLFPPEKEKKYRKKYPTEWIKDRVSPLTLNLFAFVRVATLTPFFAPNCKSQGCWWSKNKNYSAIRRGGKGKWILQVHTFKKRSRPET